MKLNWEFFSSCVHHPSFPPVRSRLHSSSTNTKFHRIWEKSERVVRLQLSLYKNSGRNESQVDIQLQCSSEIENWGTRGEKRDGKEREDKEQSSGCERDVCAETWVKLAIRCKKHFIPLRLSPLHSFRAIPFGNNIALMIRFTRFQMLAIMWMNRCRK